MSPRPLASILLASLCGCAASTVDLTLDLGPSTLARLRSPDPAGWQLRQVDGRPALQQVETRSYQPPHRSPHHIALLDGVKLGDFDLEVDAMQTGRDYPHRDLRLVFAFRDPAHFAYAHLSKEADDTAHNLLLVDDAPRRPITTWRNRGVDWGGEQWHRLRLQRRGAVVKVSFDGEPVLETDAAPAEAGFIGFGSFDDEGCFRDVVLHAPGGEAATLSCFEPLRH